MSEFQATGFVDVSASGDRSLIAIQKTTAAYRPPIPAYPDQNLVPLVKRLPQPGQSADGVPLVPGVRLDPYTIEDDWFCVGNGLDGVVLTADRKMIADMAMFSDPGRRNTGDAVLGLPVAETICDDVFVGFDAAWTNWYHWLRFALGRSAVAADSLPAGCDIVLPDCTSRVAGTHIRFSVDAWRQSIQALELEGRTKFLPPGLYRARKIRLVWTTPHGPTDITYLGLFQDAFTRVQRRLSADPGKPRRILVSRDAGSDSRASESETAALNAVAAAHGFTKVCFERMDFLTQAETVHNAECVIGVHGAGLTNILFGRPDLRLLELNRPLDGEAYLRPWFYLLAHARGQCYVQLNHAAGDFSAERIEQAIRLLLG